MGDFMELFEVVIRENSNGVGVMIGDKFQSITGKIITVVQILKVSKSGGAVYIKGTGVELR